MNEQEIKNNWPNIHDFARIINADCLELGDNVQIDDFVFLNAEERTVLENNTCLHAGTRAIGGGRLILKQNSVVTYNCVLVTGYSRYTSHMSTRVPKEAKDTLSGTIQIGCEAFVGSGSIVMPDVTLGEGAVVAAGSYIDEDVPSWTIRYPDGSTRERPEFEPY